MPEASGPTEMISFNSKWGITIPSKTLAMSGDIEKITRSLMSKFLLILDLVDLSTIFKVDLVITKVKVGNKVVTVISAEVEKAVAVAATLLLFSK